MAGKQMNNVAIENLAKVLDNIPSRYNAGFNIETYQADVRNTPQVTTHVGHQCETTCCIAGWAASVLNPDGSISCEGRTWAEVEKRARRFTHTGDLGRYGALGAKLLGLDKETAFRLFEPMNCDPHNTKDVDWDAITPRQAAKVLRHLAKTGKVDWGIVLP